MTKHMLKSFDLGNKIRVIRSGKRHARDEVLEAHASTPKKVKAKKDQSDLYRPAIGLRYDGLYTITEKECVDENWHIISLRLKGARARNLSAQRAVYRKGLQMRSTRRLWI